MTEQLKPLPCPFCGGAAHFFEITDLDEKNFGGEGICCGSCPITTDLMFSLMEDCKPKLAEAWNRRAQTAQAVPVLTDAEIHAADPIPQNRFDQERVEFARAVEAAVRAKMGVAVPYDQTALELCSVCGWKTLIPGDCCLNCERQTKADQQEPQLKRIHPLDMPLEVFLEDLPARPRNIIKAEMVYFTHSGDEYIKPPFTVRHLLMFSRSEMRKWPNLGKKSLNEIGELLRNRGLQLWEQHDERSLKFLRDHPTYWIAPPPGIVGKEGAVRAKLQLSSN